mmetsp:Transcript_15109/g.21142  ORF Transcript_15109/g.21142 Transcript_15109/m.21142 type:complete len:305 (+) Transcript_15109:828-1742(+)
MSEHAANRHGAKEDHAANVGDVEARPVSYGHEDDPCGQEHGGLVKECRMGVGDNEEGEDKDETKLLVDILQELHVFVRLGNLGEDQGVVGHEHQGAYDGARRHNTPLHKSDVLHHPVGPELGKRGPEYGEDEAAHSTAEKDLKPTSVLRVGKEAGALVLHLIRLHPLHQKEVTEGDSSHQQHLTMEPRPELPDKGLTVEADLKVCLGEHLGVGVGEFFRVIGEAFLVRQKPPGRLAGVENLLDDLIHLLLPLVLGLLRLGLLCVLQKPLGLSGLESCAVEVVDLHLTLALHHHLLALLGRDAAG